MTDTDDGTTPHGDVPAVIPPTAPAEPAGVTAPARRRPSRATVIVAAVTCAIVVAGLGTMATLREQARASMMPGPSAVETVTRFVDAARATSPAARDLLGAPLDAAFDSTGSLPFVGVPGVEQSLGMSTEITAEPPRLFAGTTPTTDENAADTARATVREQTSLAADDDRWVITTTVLLTRAFTYADGAAPGAVRPDERPTAVSEWRVTALERSDRPADLPAVDTACADAASVVRDVSRAARVDGDLAVSCALDAAPVLGAGLDEASVAAAFPVIAEQTPVIDTMHLPGGMAQVAVESSSGPLVVVLAEARTTTVDGTGWVLIGVAKDPR